METMILVWIIGLLDFCMELFDNIQNRKSIFEKTLAPFS